jgi:predicted HicB family RNase H-like nuclease
VLGPEGETRTMKHLEYKGYTGTIEYSTEDGLLYGKVIGINSILSYEGVTGVELEADFRNVIEEYLKDCNESGRKPERPFKGTFNVRISSELHRAAVLKSMELNTSLYNFVSESIRESLSVFLKSKPSSHGFKKNGL